MLYLACTTISSVDLAQYGVSLAKDWVSVECGTIVLICILFLSFRVKFLSVFSGTVHARIFKYGIHMLN